MKVSSGSWELSKYAYQSKRDACFYQCISKAFLQSLHSSERVIFYFKEYHISQLFLWIALKVFKAFFYFVLKALRSY